MGHHKEPLEGEGKRKRVDETNAMAKRSACKERQGQTVKGKVFPGWFSVAMAGWCGSDFHRAMYTGFSYGSRPGFAKKGCQMYQLNKSMGCMCIHAVMRVPFQGYRTHHSNGVLICRDNDSIYLSCMSTDCQVQ